MSDEFLIAAEKIISKLNLVRIDPQSKKNTNSQHWGRGRLLKYGKKKSLVQPMGHRKGEWIDNKYLKPWTSKLDEDSRKEIFEISEHTKSRNFHLDMLQKLSKPSKNETYSKDETFSEQIEPSENETPSNSLNEEVKNVNDSLNEVDTSSSENIDLRSVFGDIPFDKMIEQLQSIGMASVDEAFDDMKAAQKEMEQYYLLWHDCRKKAIESVKKLKKLGREVNVHIPDSPPLSFINKDSENDIATVDYSNTHLGRNKILSLIEDFFEHRKGEWISGREVMKSIGMPDVRPSQYLRELVELGKLNRQGKKAFTQYMKEK